MNYTFEFLCLILKKQTREKQLQNLFRFILFYTKNYQKVADMPRGQKIQKTARGLEMHAENVKKKALTI